MANVLIAGCGYVGTQLGHELVARGNTVWGLRRNAALLPPGIQPFPADLTRRETLRNLPPDSRLIFFTAGPDRHDESAYQDIYIEGLEALLESLDEQGQTPQRLVLASSTAVYGQNQGEWVDESSPADPGRFEGRILLAAERLVRASRFESVIVRFGGIYGPQRTGLIDSIRSGTAFCTEGPPLYTNRVHRDDCAGILQHVALLSNPESCYLGVDHEPAEKCEVLRWIAAQLNLPPPPRRAERPPSQRGSSKRCRNARLIASGYRFRYPTYREGYRRLIEAGDGSTRFAR